MIVTGGLPRYIVRRTGRARWMCNLCSQTRGQAQILAAARAIFDRTGSLPPMCGIFPDNAAPIVRNTSEDRGLTLARWGMPLPAAAIAGRNTNPGVTNVRNTKSPTGGVGSGSIVDVWFRLPASARTSINQTAQGAGTHKVDSRDGIDVIQGLRKETSVGPRPFLAQRSPIRLATTFTPQSASQPSSVTGYESQL